MKLNRSLWVLALLGLAACHPSKPEQKVDRGFFIVKRGTNIAHWLSQSDRRGEERATFFTQKDVRFIDSVGFDHIRMPIDEEQMWTESGSREEEAFTLLKNSISWCQQSGLKIIVDLHILRSHHFNAAEKPLWTKPEEQDKFIALWKDLSLFLHEWPRSQVAYELMNEPVADDPEQWNALVARAVDSIRKWEPTRVLVIGSNRWQSANTFDQLRIPQGDTSILLSYHFYEPFHLTHYHASWTRLKDFKGTVQYPGQIVLNGKESDEKRVYNRDTLEYMMRQPIHVADKLHLPLYCGEFGVIDGAPRESKIAWYKDMISIFESNGIAYANWNYKSGSFGIVDKDMKPDQQMIDILTNKKPQ